MFNVKPKYHVKMKVYLPDESTKEYERDIEEPTASKAMEFMRKDVEAQHPDVDPEDIECLECYFVREA